MGLASPIDARPPNVSQNAGSRSGLRDWREAIQTVDIHRLVCDNYHLRVVRYRAGGARDNATNWRMDASLILDAINRNHRVPPERSTHIDRG